MIIESIPRYYQIKNTPIRLWQVTHKRDGDFAELHVHNRCEINFVLSGSVSFTINDKNYALTSGDIIFVNENVPHSSVAFKDTSKIILQFPATTFVNKKLKPLYSYIQNISMDMFLFKPETEGYSQLESCLLNMIKENDEEKFAYEEFIMADTYKIIANLYRCGVLKNPDRFFSNQNYDRLFPVFEYIHTHYKEDISLEQISSLVNVDKAYFCRIFKKAMNSTLVDYINLVRISYAEKLLASSDLSIMEISETVGFGSNAYFTKLFKSHKNCTPMQYRKYKTALSNNLFS